ncbi:hypothetical protein NCS57_00966200 [Fusarium keratoplasticum]|uniref:Uncharacterized protein n=1 Tax=Fusarium keratoplasticum TaxID=1328300 RepID=A0ACC0QSZ9_9HYPO|nr:hypothetical protein NCS57_00966200 [Fusarium keratoplasticum]KAI8663647.1 hypothetical protein NCS57_00966200 [Fusarium keratoplasticum]KAI8664290.1 hypothetical protein NCS55_00937200 [Fusarium keratoplasticum]
MAYVPSPVQPVARSPYSMPESPSSISKTSTLHSVSEKEELKGTCPVHGASQTPHLEKMLQARPRAELQQLTVALNDLADENRCAKCAVQTITNIVMGYVQDVRWAKKNGKWSKEDKKALKMEIKGLAKGVKADIKSRKAEMKDEMKSH